MRKINRWIFVLRRFSRRPWYLPTLSTIAAVDLFLIVIPTDGFMVTATLFEPKRWWKLAWVFALGTAVGAIALTWGIQLFGETLFASQLEQWQSSTAWGKTLRWMDRYGVWAVFLTALGPFPIHPAIALAGIMKMDLGSVFASAFLGRLLKNLLLTWLAANMPEGLLKFRSVRKEMAKVKEP